MESISHSPIISISACSNSKLNNFKFLFVKKLFNSFIYQNGIMQQYSKNNKLSFKNSIFTDILNSAIYYSSVISLSNDIYTKQQVISTDLTIKNCCFQKCKAIQPNANGGALNLETIHIGFEYTDSIFDQCTADGVGGAISSDGATFLGKSCIFSNCKSGETGMAIFFNMNKRNGSPWPNFESIQSRFSNNEGKTDLLDLSCREIRCTYSNMTNNKNKEGNSFLSENQSCVVFSLLCEDWNTKFNFNNIIGNSGDYLININFKPDGDYQYVNIIGNYNLNYFFQFSGSNYSVKFTHFAFFNNQPRSSEDGILLSNKIDSCQFSLNNCTFDYSNDQVNAMLSGFTEKFNLYNQPLQDCGIGNAFPIDYDASLMPPSKCAIPDDVIEFDETNCVIKDQEMLDTNVTPQDTQFLSESQTISFAQVTDSQTLSFEKVTDSQSLSFAIVSSIDDTIVGETNSQDLQKFSYASSYTQSFVKIKSVSMSQLFTRMKTNTVTFNNEIGENSQILIETNVRTYLPYIIYIYSKTNIQTMILVEIINNKKKISSEKLIGITCGFVASVFAIIGIVLLFVRQKVKGATFSDIYSDISSECCETTAKVDFDITNSQIDVDDNWI